MGLNTVGPHFVHSLIYSYCIRKQVVTPRNNGGEVLCATERSGLGKDVDGVLLGVGGDDERVIRRSEGRVRRAVQENLHAELEHGVQLALTNNLCPCGSVLLCDSSNRVDVSSMHDRDMIHRLVGGQQS